MVFNYLGGVDFINSPIESVPLKMNPVTASMIRIDINSSIFIDLLIFLFRALAVGADEGHA